MKIVWQKGKMNVPKEYDQNEGWIVATLAQEMLKDAFYKYGGKLIALRTDENPQTWEYEYRALMAFALNPQETDQSADYQPLRHAHWIERARYGENSTSAICECSACGDTVWTYDDPARRWKYCQQCGAKMDEVSDESFTAEIFMNKDDIRDEEKALFEKFGEPCVVLPPYIKPHNDKIAYLCDRLACDNCHPETCSHTTDIRHAKNFVLVGDDRYMEEKK